MYQSFTGQSRKPRNINLSGRLSNPFANPSSPTQGPNSAVVSAQQDRINRQNQRERLQACSRIQRTWRGHSARRRTFALWRQLWDEVEDEESARHGPYRTEDESLRQLLRLLLFHSPHEDAKRLTWYGMRQMTTNDSIRCEGGPWPMAYLKLSRACVATLRAGKVARSGSDKELLTLLAFAARRTQISRGEAMTYYEVLTSLEDAPPDPLQNALLAPLQSSAEAYSGLAVQLEKPYSNSMLSSIRSSVDPVALAKAMASLGDQQGDGSVRGKLWLLGNIIFLAGHTRSQDLTSIVARLVGFLADCIDFEGRPVDMPNLEFDAEVLSKLTTDLQLNTFLHDQVMSLINQNAIRNLLCQYTSGQSKSPVDPQVLAAYAVTLLQCFRGRADEIRMWLYLGPTQASSRDLPATQYFWKAAKSSTVFSSVRENTRNVMSLLKLSPPDATVRGEWTFILVFLELYTFLLKILDDEQFFGDGKRSGGIPLTEVGDLVTFLKNLGFTLYVSSLELDISSAEVARNLDTNRRSRQYGSSGAAVELARAEREKRPFQIAGIPGLTVEYLKGLVTGLLRAVYDRDSRRRFLANDHWLMTSQFEMTSFIPGVVAEEESRHKVQEQDEDDMSDESSDSDDLFGPTPRIRGPGAALRSQEARARAQRKASRKRYLDAVAPRLKILQNMPFFIPFTTRVEIFRQFVQLDKAKRRNGYTEPDMWRQNVTFHLGVGASPGDVLARHHARIRRKNEFGDAFEQFYDLGAGLKEPIQITFVDEFDIPEAGIDGGGEFPASLRAAVIDY